MALNFIIKALPYSEFSDLFNLNDSDLIKIGAIRMKVDSKPGFPCRVSLQDAEIGEEVILINYEHHKTSSPYRSNGPVFIRKNAITAILKINEIPDMLINRLLSLRAFDKNGMLKLSTVCEGRNLSGELISFFKYEDVSYIHIHNAKPGCYNCMAERAE
jgi:hypothetical protein